MKPNVPSTNARFYSRRLACFPEISLRWAVAQPDLSFALPRGDSDGATDQTFRLIVKPDLWSKTIRLRLANTFGSRPITLGAALWWL